MLVTISTTGLPAATGLPATPATDLGYLVHKHPDRSQAFEVAMGTAHVSWPEATAERSTVALLLEVDPVALVRRGRGSKRQGSDGFSLSQYVNDRPYAASSMLSVALGKVFRTAMSGRCDSRPELAARPIPLEINLPAVPSGGDPELVTRFFGPLGWDVHVTTIPLDPTIPAWGDSRYLTLRLRGELRLADALTQLYVLLPVLDDSKHYWVGEDEVDKLMRAGDSWLPGHPERELITRRYLRYRRELLSSAVAGDEAPDPPAPLSRLRTDAVLAVLRAEGAADIVDLGCGEGALLRELIRDPVFTRVIGVDVSHRALELAEKRLGLDRMPDTQRARLELIASAATYRDDRLAGHDAIVLMEVIEHVDQPRLPALERTVFGHARPVVVVVTTPNAEYNVRYEKLAAGTMRHRDHRFEWTRGQFAAWGDGTAAAYGYTVKYLPIGEVDPLVGSSTQLAVFRRSG